MKKNNPLVSVIITTKNEADVIGRLLKSIETQSYKNIEVIVVDNDSIDSTLEIVKKFKCKTFTYGPERSAQRNYGVKKSKGEYVLILDADMELTKNVILECVEVFGRATGEVVIPEQSVATSLWEKVKAYERSFYANEDISDVEAARFFKRSLFNRVGGYDISITGPEDWDLPERISKLGYNVKKIKSKILHHERIKSLYSLAYKKYYYGQKAHRYLSKQNVGIFSAKTIYFLRPEFYRQWKKLLSHPIMTILMISMFIAELIGGGFGFLTGKIRKK